MYHPAHFQAHRLNGQRGGYSKASNTNERYPNSVFLAPTSSIGMLLGSYHPDHSGKHSQQPTDLGNEPNILIKRDRVVIKSSTSFFNTYGKLLKYKCTKVQQTGAMQQIEQTLWSTPALIKQFSSQNNNNNNNNIPSCLDTIEREALNHISDYNSTILVNTPVRLSASEIISTLLDEDLPWPTKQEFIDHNEFEQRLNDVLEVIQTDTKVNHINNRSYHLSDYHNKSHYNQCYYTLHSKLFLKDFGLIQSEQQQHHQPQAVSSIRPQGIEGLMPINLSTKHDINDNIDERKQGKLNNSKMFNIEMASANIPNYMNKSHQSKVPSITQRRLTSASIIKENSIQMGTIESHSIKEIIPINQPTKQSNHYDNEISFGGNADEVKRNYSTTFNTAMLRTMPKYINDSYQQSSNVSLPVNAEEELKKYFIDYGPLCNESLSISLGQQLGILPIKVQTWFEENRQRLITFIARKEGRINQMSTGLLNDTTKIFYSKMNGTQRERQIIRNYSSKLFGLQPLGQI